MKNLSFSQVILAFVVVAVWTSSLNAAPRGPLARYSKKFIDFELEKRAKASCEREVAKDCAFLATEYLSGAGSLQRARELFEKACDLGHSVSCAQLGYLYLDGEGGRQDLQNAKIVFEKTCGGELTTEKTKETNLLLELGSDILNKIK